MAIEDPAYVASLDADVNADRDVWTIVNSFNNHQSLASTDLLNALASNRKILINLQLRYATVVEQEGGIDKPASRERRAYFKELNRLFSALDAIKTDLRMRGEDFEFSYMDEEHPNAAYRRYAKVWAAERRRAAEERLANERRSKNECFIVTAVTTHPLRRCDSGVAG